QIDEKVCTRRQRRNKLRDTGLETETDAGGYQPNQETHHVCFRWRRRFHRQAWIASRCRESIKTRKDQKRCRYQQHCAPRLYQASSRVRNQIANRQIAESKGHLEDMSARQAPDSKW